MTRGILHKGCAREMWHADVPTSSTMKLGRKWTKSISWAGLRYEPSEEEGVSAVALEKNRHPRCVEGPYLFAYQYLMWQFSQAWLMPSPTSRSLSLSFASMACSTGTTLSYRSSAIFVKLARSSLISASI